MEMKMEICREDLINLVNLQLNNLLGSSGNVKNYVDTTLERLSKCFKLTKDKYYRSSNNCKFSPYHSGQYSIFLYYLANTIHREAGDSELSTKLYYLNKIMNSVDWYYEIALPEYFGVEHPMGSVLGRARYSDGFYIFQGCTVGGDKGTNPNYPQIGKNVIMYSNSTVLGEVNIGKNVIISTGTTIINENIPDGCIVFGHSPNLLIKEKSLSEINKHISEFWLI
ncbi:transferase [Anoxynatronum buryatiense]|uniref:Serine O-acetyltransferase n=1 Tax=Anoxynatronum buryatiense TaxID=489973 RepID=A0AA45WW64_9CLOT|nr:transferase [Anoxynatronum buryatiense]SMP56812.1 serine O-acetyltransferase [Anoxynatronum buryatiense]